MKFEEAFLELRNLLEECARTLAAPLEAATRITSASLATGGKILVCGNGGSAADAQHFVAELVVRFEANRRALPAIALTTDSSILTAGANDLGFERVFARQVEAFGRPGDVVICISTSGNSPNVVRAAEQARAQGCRVIAFTGGGGGRLSDHADVLVAVPSNRVARIQEVHEVSLHTLAGALESALCGSVDESR